MRGGGQMGCTSKMSMEAGRHDSPRRDRRREKTGPLGRGVMACTSGWSLSCEVAASRGVLSLSPVCTSTGPSDEARF